MSENLFGLTVAADKGLDDLQCQRLLSENRRYQEVMLQYRCALKALESRLENKKHLPINAEVDTGLKECADSTIDSENGTANWDIYCTS